MAEQSFGFQPNVRGGGPATGGLWGNRVFQHPVNNRCITAWSQLDGETLDNSNRYNVAFLDVYPNTFCFHDEVDLHEVTYIRRVTGGHYYFTRKRFTHSGTAIVCSTDNYTFDLPPAAIDAFYTCRYDEYYYGLYYVTYDVGTFVIHIVTVLIPEQEYWDDVVLTLDSDDGIPNDYPLEMAMHDDSLYVLYLDSPAYSYGVKLFEVELSQGGGAAGSLLFSHDTGGTVWTTRYGASGRYAGRLFFGADGTPYVAGRYVENSVAGQTCAGVAFRWGGGSYVTTQGPTLTDIYQYSNVDASGDPTGDQKGSETYNAVFYTKYAQNGGSYYFSRAEISTSAMSVTNFGPYASNSDCSTAMTNDRHQFLYSYSTMSPGPGIGYYYDDIGHLLLMEDDGTSGGELVLPEGETLKGVLNSCDRDEGYVYVLTSQHIYGYRMDTLEIAVAITHSSSQSSPCQDLFSYGNFIVSYQDELTKPTSGYLTYIWNQDYVPPVVPTSYNEVMMIVEQN